ncbi:MAG: adenylate/guanylate cyclase domain-containing protein [Gammaproteobacteria bacterium]|jgi:hypothetical protein|nr:adenylate/guanylate cyclase domain-containing protein [Gammaproteobacteria bacterium]MDP6733185.1 adenylate/guanylate cyclase domain-containing protein [Gammaproteobacteria bacterium]|tara:strand:+ start:3432 stop:3812 length:381 start_codon:yes stop_codon:yes gene_type:complete
MLKTSTVIKIDIRGFDAVARQQTPTETADYLAEYYSLINDALSSHGWRFVKAIGDCVLISAEQNESEINIREFLDCIRTRFEVDLHYRNCHFEEMPFSYGSYSCLDTIGKDINKLFLQDTETVHLE